VYPVSSAYLRATRSSHQFSVVCEAWRGGQLLDTDLMILSGSVTDNSKPGVRRQLDITVQPTEGLYDQLAPIGTELRVKSLLRFPRGETETVPMGVFDVDSASIGYGPGGSMKISASDRWGKVQRARFLAPRAATPGNSIIGQITEWLDEVFPGLPPIVNIQSSARVGTVVWEKERDKAILDMAESIGGWVYFDRNGTPVIDQLPVGAPTAGVWEVDAGKDGILLEADRSTDRTRSYNVVVAATDKSDGTALFEPQIVWDDDPYSPTYAGTDPATGANAGPFGVVPYFFSSPLLETADQAREAGLTILTRTVGLNKQLSLSAVRNHALDAMDPISVRLPPPRYRAEITGYRQELQAAVGAEFGTAPFGTAPFGGVAMTSTPVVEYLNNGPVERHRVDKIVHPLTPDGAQQIDTRSTRTDEYS
jgi:hypothetical protein